MSTPVVSWSHHPQLVEAAREVSPPSEGGVTLFHARSQRWPHWKDSVQTNVRELKGSLHTRIQSDFL